MSPSKRTASFLALSAGLLMLATLPPAARAQAPPPANTCLDCHSALDGPLQVKPQDYARDIHVQKGLTCADCHGGDPSSPDNAMSPKAGFRGKIKRADVPQLCARCHSNADYMRRYNPSLRTDQLSQYLTSVHGKRRLAGDDQVAVCTDCHGLHGILPARDPASQVHPTHVAETCARCHADAAHMKPYPIATDQYAGYRVSVHHAALMERGDLSAPTCTTCHGNHGAAPPGVASVANVCSTCHVFQAQLFAASPHQAAFAAAKLPGCVTCHSNHRIEKATDAKLGVGPQSVCTNCHVEGDAGYKAAQQLQQHLITLSTAIAGADDLLERAERSGMEVSAAKLEQAQAHDTLTKARVNIHSFRPAALEPDIKAGLKIAEAGRVAGEKALAEREYRRKGLGFSVLAIFVVLIGLWLFVRELERPQKK